MNFRQVHLDFHTSEKIEGIGEKFDKKQFQGALIRGHVNSITLFSKCHHGWAYHPSEANEIHPNLKFDLLKAQIEAAHEIGVKTPVYLSGGLDEKMALRHPEWLVRNKDESTFWTKDFVSAGYHKFCMNSGYLDYFLEQIKEVCRNYDADGIFIDIVGVQPCYCNNCLRALKERGLDPNDSGNVWLIADETYRNYAKRVREAIDSVKPGLPLFHNSGHIKRGNTERIFYNTHLEIESLPTGGWGYDHFPLSAAYVRSLGLDYLGMTGKFHTSWGEFGGFKHPNALRYEVALSAAFGAKCSIGDQLHPSGKMDMVTYDLIGRAYSELEEKEPWLDHTTAVTDIGVICVEATSGIQTTGQTAKTEGSDSGAVRTLLEGKYLFDIIDMSFDFNKYKVIIMPDCIPVNAELTAKLKDFLKNGGQVLATGVSAIDASTNEFSLDFGVKYKGICQYRPSYFKPAFSAENIGDTGYVFYETGHEVELTDGEVLGYRENPYFNRTLEHFCSHKHAPSTEEIAGPGMVKGKDGIYIAWDAFNEYAELGTLFVKLIIHHALDILLGNNKSLKTNLPAQGVTTLTKQESENRYIAHFLYACPVRRGRNVEVIEDIIPVYNVEAELKIKEKIKNAYLAPSGEKIGFTQNGDTVSFTVPKLENHQMVVLDY